MTEISACRKFLTEFSRNPGQDFASCIQLFDSVYAHYSHLQAPRKKLEVQRSIEDLIIQITPFLLSDTAAKVFTSWAEDHSYGNQSLDIDTIITIVDKLERHPECQLHEAKRLPICPISIVVVHSLKLYLLLQQIFANVHSAAPKPGSGRSTSRNSSNY